MGENIFKWCDQKGINFQNIRIAHTAQYQKNNPIKKYVEDINRHFSKEIQIAKRHLKRCSTSLSEKCRSKLQWCITSQLWEWLSSKRTMCWWECGEKRTLAHYWWDCKLMQSLWKRVWSFIKKLKIELPGVSHSVTSNSLLPHGL